MKRVATLLPLALLAALSARAETPDDAGPVYSPETGKRVKALNDTVETLRDPTRLTESFRQAMKNIAPRSGGGQSTADEPYNLPEITLAGLVQGGKKTPSVMLRIEEKLFLVREGDTVPFVKDSALIQVVVEHITADEIRILVLPYREQLTLR